MDSPQAYDASLTLQPERFIVLRKLNDLQAKTSRFPVEVLSMIFLHVRPPIDFRTPYEDFVAWEEDVFPNHVQADYLHTLTAVSHLWRQVAISTPQLWTTVARTVDENSIQSVLSLLDLHFRNARTLPISIELDFDPFWNPDKSDAESLDQEYEQSISLLKPFKAALFAANRAAMIRYLALLYPPEGWLPSFNKKFSQCHSVVLVQPMFDPDDNNRRNFLDLADLPCLKHIELIDCCGRYSIPEGVTSLKLREVETDMVKSLEKSTNLVDLQIMRVYGPTHFQTPRIWPQLEHFGCGSSFFICGFTGDIQLPNIRSLHWYNDNDFITSTNAEILEAHLRFFSNLPHSLTSLTVVGLPDNRDDIQIHDYLTYLPQLSELHFINLPKNELQLAITAIGRRSSTTNSRGLPGVKVLPNLRKLTLAAYLNDSAEKAIEESSPLMFVEMLEALRSGGGNQSDFLLTLDEFREDFHDPLICRRLRALEKDGFNVEIILGSHTLDFSEAFAAD